MKYSSKILRSSLCLSQAALLAFGPFALPSLAATPGLSAAENARLVQYEDMLFGEKRSSQNAETRLGSIEKNLFGSVKSGSTASRLDAIAKILGNGKSSLLFPPIPPQLDGLPSSNANAPASSLVPAPSYSTSNSSQSSGSASYQSASSASYQSSSQDQAAEVLKNAITLYSAGRTAEAEREFKKVLTLDRNNVDAHFNLGAIAEGRGSLDVALDEYKAAYRLNPNDLELKDAVASVEAKLRDQVAQKSAERERQLASARQTQELQKREQLKSKIAQASSAYKGGNFDQAIGLLQQVAAQAPQDADVQYALAQAYKGKGDLNRSRQALNQALASAPNNQLYRDALNDLNNRQSQKQDQEAVASSAPAGSTTPYAPSYNPAPQQSDVYSTGGVDTARAGEIVPFSGRGGSSYGFMPAYASRSGGGIGPISSTRLKRAAVGGLAGAAIGALMGTVNRSGVKGNAIRGAIMGGAFGLLGF